MDYSGMDVGVHVLCNCLLRGNENNADSKFEQNKRIKHSKRSTCANLFNHLHVPVFLCFIDYHATNYNTLSQLNSLYRLLYNFMTV